MLEHGGFNIESNFIKCRKLRSPTKKIIFSIVSPTIPNDILERYIVNELKIKLHSGISILRVNPVDQLFGHIITFRRQVYTSGDFDTSTLPGSFELTHEDRTHRIFITFDELSCFRCKSKGHKAEDCPHNENDFVQPAIDPIASNFPPLPATIISEKTNETNDSSSYATPISDTENFTDHQTTPTPDRSFEPSKRPLSTTSTSDTTSLRSLRVYFTFTKLFHCIFENAGVINKQNFYSKYTNFIQGSVYASLRTTASN